MGALGPEQHFSTGSFRHEIATSENSTCETALSRRTRFESAGVYYAATAHEGPLCRGSTVIVAGGGNSAGQAAMFLSEGADKVLLVIRGDDLSKSMSSYLSRRVETKPNIEILRGTEIRKMSGAQHLESVELENTQTGERRTVQTPAVFSMIGVRPCTDWLPAEIERDGKGFVKTVAIANVPAWKSTVRSPGVLETSRPGILIGLFHRRDSPVRKNAEQHL
ncbi:MAG TPA: FAD-dependent oxidoreductase, partial [Terrimicrobium sp.]